jgi:hypothetical protein
VSREHAYLAIFTQEEQEAFDRWLKLTDEQKQAMNVRCNRVVTGVGIQEMDA